MTTALERGRQAFADDSWADAYGALTDADRESPLGPQDLELVATIAFLTGKDRETEDFWARGHHAYLKLGDVTGAARCAFRAGFGLINRAQFAPAMGWFGRAQRLL